MQRSAAEILRDARRRAGISQRSLAIRAGTKQSTISRLESGAEVPTLERLQRLLLVLGFALELDLKPLEHPYDREAIAAAKRLPMEERVRQAAAWNKFAGQLDQAAAKR